MELDLRYKQYELATNTAEKKEEVSETEIVVNKPFQEVIDFFDE